ncbi:MAG: tripartite tricarboxylate transporter substrate binding protein [Treponema sp.]|nr:tripartite tricarboxylate transporter substrate binding protein [Treponema sp.]
MEKRMKRTAFILCVCALGFSLAACERREVDPAEAVANFPSRPITIIVPPAAGGGTDILVRALAPALRDVLGQNVIVVNRPGAGGAIGFSSGARENPDGYSIIALVPELIAVPHVANVDFTYRDFDIIAMVNSTFGTLSVNANAPYQTVQEFVEYARRYPGTIRFSNSGIGGNWHILAAAFASHADINVIHVPFDGGGPSAIAVAGAHVEATTASAQEMDIHVQAGNIRILCIFSPERDPSFPDVPTAAEVGFPEPILTIFRGFGVPRGTHPEIIAILADAFRQVIEKPEIISFMQTNHFTIDYRNAGDFLELIQRENEIYREQAEALGLRQ